jgi:uncharacterized protein YkwD
MSNVSLSRARRTLPALTLILVACATAPAAAVAAPSGREAAVAAKLSATRQKLGLRAVRISPALSSACRAYARHLLTHGAFVHSSDRGPTGEILAVWPKGTDQPSAVVHMWMGSAPHHAVIVNNRWSRIGVASVTGRFRGHKMTMWVVRFAR